MGALLRAADTQPWTIGRFNAHSTCITLLPGDPAHSGRQPRLRVSAGGGRGHLLPSNFCLIQPLQQPARSHGRAACLCHRSQSAQAAEAQRRRVALIGVVRGAGGLHDLQLRVGAGERGDFAGAEAKNPV